MMKDIKEYSVNEKPQWCPGCGNFGLLTAVKSAFAELDLEPHNTVVVSGIGCGSKIPHYLRTYGYEGIHGRIIPLAEGIKIGNPSLTVVGIGGDGDGLSEGGNHFLHGGRKNTDITYIVQDNQIYGLTTGQASPTTHLGMKTKTTPNGVFIPPVKPIPTALISGATFVASAFAGDINHLKEVIKRAIQHRGFSFIDVYQPCVSWNKINTYMWWKERVYKLDKSLSFEEALKKAMEPYLTNWEKVPIGVFYESNERKPLNEIINYGNELLTNIEEDLREFE